jgi:hypothetical protein
MTGEPGWTEEDDEKMLGAAAEAGITVQAGLNAGARLYAVSVRD